MNYRVLKNVLWLSTAIQLSFLSHQVIAQDADTIDLGEITIQSVDDVNVGAADRGASKYITNETLEDTVSGDLKDVFAGEASVNVGGGVSIGQKVFVNGVDQLNLAVTVDGISQNNRVFHHVSANAIDPGLLKSVRVDAGVAAADVGPHALGGAIAYETVDAQDLLAEGVDFGGKAALSFDSNGNTFTEMLTLFGRSGNFEYLGYVKNSNGGDYTTGGGLEIAGSSADLQSFMLKTAYEDDAGHRIEFSGLQAIDDAQRAYRANFAGLTTGNPAGFVGETRIYDTKRQNYAISYSNTQASDMFDPEFTFGYSRTDVDVLEPYNSLGTSDTYSGKFQNTFHLSADDTISAGIDFYRNSSVYEDGTDVFEESSRNFGAFVQARFAPTARLKLSTGLRADQQKFEGISGYTDTVEGLSANASLKYEIVDGLTFNAGYSNVFGGISLEDNYIFEDTFTYDDVVASRSENYVVGFEYALKRATFSAEVFETNVRDIRNGTSSANFQTQGYNLSASYRWNAGFARLTFADSEITVNEGLASAYDALDYGTPLGQVISLQAEHTLADYNLTLGGSVEAALDYDGTGEIAGSNPLDGYTVLNLFAEYKPRRVEGLTLRLEANNIFDEDYADRATYGIEYASVEEFSEPGRSVMLSMNYDF